MSRTDRSILESLPPLNINLRHIYEPMLWRFPSPPPAKATTPSSTSTRGSGVVAGAPDPALPAEEDE